MSNSISPYTAILQLAKLQDANEYETKGSYKAGTAKTEQNIIILGKDYILVDKRPTSIFSKFKRMISDLFNGRERDLSKLSERFSDIFSFVETDQTIEFTPTFIGDIRRAQNSLRAMHARTKNTEARDQYTNIISRLDRAIANHPIKERPKTKREVADNFREQGVPVPHQLLAKTPSDESLDKVRTRTPSNGSTASRSSSGTTDSTVSVGSIATTSTASSTRSMAAKDAGGKSPVHLAPVRKLDAPVSPKRDFMSIATEAPQSYSQFFGQVKAVADTFPKAGLFNDVMARFEQNIPKNKKWFDLMVAFKAGKSIDKAHQQLILTTFMSTATNYNIGSTL